MLQRFALEGTESSRQQTSTPGRPAQLEPPQAAFTRCTTYSACSCQRDERLLHQDSVLCQISVASLSAVFPERSQTLGAVKQRCCQLLPQNLVGPQALLGRGNGKAPSTKTTTVLLEAKWKPTTCHSPVYRPATRHPCLQRLPRQAGLHQSNDAFPARRSPLPQVPPRFDRCCRTCDVDALLS